MRSAKETGRTFAPSAVLPASGTQWRQSSISAGESPARSQYAAAQLGEAPAAVREHRAVAAGRARLADDEHFLARFGVRDARQRRLARGGLGRALRALRRRGRDAHAVSVDLDSGRDVARDVDGGLRRTRRRRRRLLGDEELPPDQDQEAEGQGDQETLVQEDSSSFSMR